MNDLSKPQQTAVPNTAVDKQTELRRAALEFLATSRMTGWMTAAMEGR